MVSVAVVMSTYNGEKYLREQLDSILRQNAVKVKIFIHDDCSVDGTKEILTGLANDNPDIQIEFGENVGVGNSFMNLLYSVPDSFDYYAFADQDDIWDAYKLIEAIKLLQESNKLLYASNQECVDKYGNHLYLRYGEDTKIHLTPESILGENMLAGCTMVLAKSFFQLLTREDKRPEPSLLRNRIHDVWLSMVASLFDGIVYDSRSFMKYRQHENNVVGAKTSLSKKIKDKMKKITHREYRNGRSLLAKQIIAKFPVEADNFPLIKICANSKTWKGKSAILKNQKELRSYTKEGYFGFFVKVMFGLF